MNLGPNLVNQLPLEQEGLIRHMMDKLDEGVRLGEVVSHEHGETLVLNKRGDDVTGDLLLCR